MTGFQFVLDKCCCGLFCCLWYDMLRGRSSCVLAWLLLCSTCLQKAYYTRQRHYWPFQFDAVMLRVTFACTCSSDLLVMYRIIQMLFSARPAHITARINKIVGHAQTRNHSEDLTAGLSVPQLTDHIVCKHIRSS